MSQVQLTGRGKRVCEANADRISDLPSVITEQILEFLPLKETARTSMLSKHWRYLWLLLPQLILDKPFFESMVLSNGPADTLQSYMNIVEDVLFRCVGPIHKFALYVPYISPWIDIVNDKGITEVSVDEFCRLSDPKLPSSLFSCLSLTHLTLNISSCVIGPLPPMFSGFPCLTDLHLHVGRSCTEVDTVEALISSCPRLERLNLHLDTISNVNITIDSLNFRHLVFTGSTPRMHFKGTTEMKLKALSLGAQMGYGRQLSELLEVFRNVETIILTNPIWKARYIKGKAEVSNELGQLKTLKLFEIPISNSHWALSLLVSFFLNSPRLQQLEINVSIFSLPERNGHIVLHDLKDLNLQCLRRVALVCISGSPTELKLIQLLLARSSVLELMTVELSKETEDAEEIIAMEVMDNRQASAKAEIIVTW